MLLQPAPFTRSRWFLSAVSVLTMSMMGSGVKVGTQDDHGPPKLKLVFKALPGNKNDPLLPPGNQGNLGLDVEFEVPLQTLAQFPEEIRKAIDEWRKRGKQDAQDLHRDILRIMKKHRVVDPGAHAPHAQRLGMHLEKLPSALIDQLNLPKDQGLFVSKVQPDSHAARAGIKVNDILLKLDGQPVGADPLAVAKMFEALKSVRTFDVVVLRHGKEETIKDLANHVSSTTSFFTLPSLNPSGARAGANSNPNVMITTFRTGDRFNTRYQEGSLIIHVSGNVKEGKTQVQEIQIQDGVMSQRYETLDKVPASYRDKVQHLVRTASGDNIRIDGK